MSEDKKSDLEKKVEQGLYGPPEIKKEEKNRYLGEFKERVIKYLTYDQVMEKGTYPQIMKAINNKKAKKLIIDRNVDMDYAQDYINLARKNNLDFKRVDSPEFKGEIALVVVSDRAVDIKNRKIMKREERLQKLGLSDNIIKNAGAKLCDKCWNEVKEKAPEVLDNYKKMSWLDKLLKEKCTGCQN